MGKSKGRGVRFYVLILLIFLLFAMMYRSLQSSVQQTMTYEQFEECIKDDNVIAVTVNQNAEVPTGEVRLTYSTGLVQHMYVSDVNAITEELNKKYPAYTLNDVKREGWFSTYVLPSLIIVVLMIVFFTYMNGAAGGGNKMMNFGKSHAKLSKDDNKMSFKDVAGLDEEKEDLEELVDFLRNPKKYVDVGARIPKGVILVGPPGTGKTLLAKAIAG